MFTVSGFVFFFSLSLSATLQENNDIGHFDWDKKNKAQ